MASNTSQTLEQTSDSDSSCGTSAPMKRCRRKKEECKVNKRVFRNEWTFIEAYKGKGWLTKVKDDDTVFKCSACNIIPGIKSGRRELDSHAKSQKHMTNIQNIKNSVSIKSAFMRLNEERNKNTDHQKEIQQSEIKLATFFAEHNIAISVVDELLPLMKDIAKNPTVLQDMTLGRTKCSKFLKNVVAQVETDNLSAILRNNRFSILIDESTDVSCDKYLCLLARFVCPTSGNIKTLVSDMIKMNSLDLGAEAIYAAFHRSLTAKNSPAKNIIGLASDGASVMMGKNNSFQSRLSKDTDTLVLLKCICHSSALIASKACKNIPNVEDLLRALSSYMSCSSKRAAELTELQEYFDIKQNRILKLSTTRWLSMGHCIIRVLNNWSVLQHFFLRASLEDKLKQTDFIRQSLNLLFLKYVLTYCHNFNALFQSDKVLIHCLNKESRRLFNVIGQNFLKTSCLQYNINCKNPNNLLDLSEIYLGPECETFLLELDHQVRLKNRIKTKCRNFYITALTQIQGRLPLVDDLFTEMEFIDPTVVLSKNRPEHLKTLNHLIAKFGIILSSHSDVMLEWRSLPYQMTESDIQIFKSLEIEGILVPVIKIEEF